MKEKKQTSTECITDLSIKINLENSRGKPAEDCMGRRHIGTLAMLRKFVVFFIQFNVPRLDYFTPTETSQSVGGAKRE